MFVSITSDKVSAQSFFMKWFCARANSKYQASPWGEGSGDKATLGPPRYCLLFSTCQISWNILTCWAKEPIGTIPPYDLLVGNLPQQVYSCFLSTTSKLSVRLQCCVPLWRVWDYWGRAGILRLLCKGTFIKREKVILLRVFDTKFQNSRNTTSGIPPWQ